MKKREEEINKCILEWLIVKNYTNSIEPFLQDAGLQKSDATESEVDDEEEYEDDDFDFEDEDYFDCSFSYIF